MRSTTGETPETQEAPEAAIPAQRTIVTDGGTGEAPSAAAVAPPAPAHIIHQAAAQAVMAPRLITPPFVVAIDESGAPSTRERFKALLLGNSHAGKTEMLNAMVGHGYDDHYISTIGVDFRYCPIDMPDGSQTRYQIWDSAGQERFNTITTSYFKAADVVLIMGDNAENLNHWAAMCRRGLPKSTFYTVHYDADHRRATLEPFNQENLARACTQAAVSVELQREFGRNLLAVATQRINAARAPSAAASAAAVSAAAPARSAAPAAAGGAGAASAGSSALSAISSVFSGLFARSAAAAPAHVAAAAPAPAPAPAQHAVQTGLGSINS